MAKNRNLPMAIAVKRTRDGFMNPPARIGQGTDNPNSGAFYGMYRAITRNPIMLYTMFRQSWVIRKSVTAVAEDMTREGIEFKCQWDPTDKDRVRKEMMRLKIWASLLDVLQWARLLGGASVVPMIDGQDLSTPLNLDTVGIGQFRGLRVFDRWTLFPLLETRVEEQGPEFGLPEYYELTNQRETGKRVHYSRVIRFIGDPLPYWESLREELWGASIVESFFDRLVAFDTASEGAAQLVHRAYLRTVHIEGLRQIMAAGGKLQAALEKHMDMIRKWQTSEGLTLLDKNDEFQALSYTFSGLDKVLLSFGEQLAGATGIPLVRLFGQSPAGLNATGDSDIRTYYDLIGAKQDKDLTTPLYWIYALISRSLFGQPLPDDFSFDYAPLWKMSETEKSTIASQDAASITNAHKEGIITQATALRELRESGQVTGRWGSITDEEIADAETGPPLLSGISGLSGGG